MHIYSFVFVNRHHSIDYDLFKFLSLFCSFFSFFFFLFKFFTYNIIARNTLYPMSVLILIIIMIVKVVVVLKCSLIYWSAFRMNRNMIEHMIAHWFVLIKYTSEMRSKIATEHKITKHFAVIVDHTQTFLCFLFVCLILVFMRRFSLIHFLFYIDIFNVLSLSRTCIRTSYIFSVLFCFYLNHSPNLLFLFI